MNRQVMEAIFNIWVEDGDYKQQSVLENGAYRKVLEKLQPILNREDYNRISDDVGNLAYESEIAGFNRGFRYGVMFMRGLLKGGKGLCGE